MVGDPFEIDSVGVCCDKCATTENCQGWAVQGNTCTMLKNTTGRHEACETCISGHDIVNKAADSTASQQEKAASSRVAV